MALIDEDRDVRALRTPGGFDWSRLGASDTALTLAWAKQEQDAQGDPPPEHALRSSVLAGVWAIEHLSVRAQPGWKKYVLFFTGLNAAIWDDAYPTDAGIFVEWALAAIERHGWGPDGNASPLGQLHSMCMSKWRARTDASGRYLPPDGADASVAATVEIVATLAEHARGRYSGEIDPFTAWPIDRMLRDLPAEEADAFIRSLTPAAVAVMAGACTARQTRSCGHEAT